MYVFVVDQTHFYKSQAIWKVMVTSSSRDHGTLWHLGSLLGRLPVAKDPKKDMNACTDLLIIVL